MAIDANILLQSRAGSVNPLFSGLQAGQQLAQAPMQNQLLQQRATSNQQSIDATNQKNQIQQALLAYNHANQLKSLPEGPQRDAAHAQFIRQMESMGYKDDGAPDDLSNAGLDTVISGLKPVYDYAQRTNMYKKEPDPYYTTFQSSTGTYKVNTRSGQIEQVQDAGGNPVLPVAADPKVQASVAGAKQDAVNASDLANKPTIAASTKAAEQAIKQSGEAIDQLATVKSTIANIDDAISAIDNGANSGVIASKLPSVSSASIELDNARQRLGLNIIQGTTFGALSEGELRLALDTAVPSNLPPKELRAWLVKKKDAQKKLSKELENAAIYLGKPGNTPAGFLEMRRNETGASDAPSLDDLVNKYAD